MAKFDKKFRVFFVLERGPWQTDIMSDTIWADTEKQAASFMRYNKCLKEYAPYRGWSFIVVKVEEISTLPPKPVQLVLPGFGGDQK